ncbi:MULTISPECIES: hypothetical protein [Shouchella]|uniref:hypothetical protein n=1 Tax=Shouchella TaxID=2893057 RepID=UPI000919C9E0|nr:MULTISPECIES: hypothetical protein [Shouchella]MBX0317437.1 hypothetical protein [Shouchella clausii]MCM3314407.1 hypothetical protein [Psychrobacillus sp. MER TA 17]PAE80096.1 hypothetical protein CHH77_17460 [Shouchella clausii]SHL86519.1 hypothetical protein SAMN05192535_3711 [Shouchella rhizosphaerae]
MYRLLVMPILALALVGCTESKDTPQTTNTSQPTNTPQLLRETILNPHVIHLDPKDIPDTNGLEYVEAESHPSYVDPDTGHTIHLERDG